MAKKRQQKGQLFFYKGASTNGRRIENITYDAMMDLMKQSKEMLKQQQADEALDPIINAEVRKVGAQNFEKNLGPNREPMQGIPVEEDSVMSGLDNIKSSKEDTSGLERILSNLPPPQGQPGALGGFETGIEQQAPTQPSIESSSLLEGLPPEMLRDLIAEYHAGVTTGSKFWAEVKKLRKEQWDIEQDIRKREAIGGGKGGGGATGARLRERTPELIAAAGKIVDEMESSEEYDVMTISKARELSKADPLQFLYQGTGKSLGVDESVRKFDKLFPKKIALSGETAAASTAGRELTHREIQKENPMLSDAQSGSITDAYNAIDYLNILKSQVQSGDAGYFDVNRKTGQFLNPEVGDAFLQMVEIIGRKRSGAAINEGEWKNFGKQILNKNFLLTEEGRMAAIKSIDRYLDKFYGAGVTTTGNEDWYSVYKKKTSAARTKGEEARGDIKPAELPTDDDIISRYLQ